MMETCLACLRNSRGQQNGNPLQYSCLENPMDRVAWWATVHRVARVGKTEHASNLGGGEN